VQSSQWFVWEETRALTQRGMSGNSERFQKVRIVVYRLAINQKDRRAAVTQVISFCGVSKMVFW
jgi:hypothetical protein